MLRVLRRIAYVLTVVGLLSASPVSTQASSSFLKSLAATPSLSANTIPSNGDQNPYGVAVVPAGFPSNGTTRAGDILVNNFNDSANAQGTGTTIVSITPSGHVTTFFTAPASIAPVGLTTALVALRSGLVVVGNTPTDASGAVQNGSLIFLDQRGHLLLNLKNASLLRDPWDMTADDRNPSAPVLYVSNVVSGTVTRINVRVERDEGRW
jgi:hypothetical protein